MFCAAVFSQLLIISLHTVFNLFCNDVSGKSIQGATGILHNHFNAHHTIFVGNLANQDNVQPATSFPTCQTCSKIVGFLFSCIYTTASSLVNQALFDFFRN
jgi:hypothetical protein